MNNSKKITRREKKSKILGKKVKSTYKFLPFLTFWHCLLFKEIVLTGDNCITDIQEIHRITRLSEYRLRRKTVGVIICASACQCKSRTGKGLKHVSCYIPRKPFLFHIFLQGLFHNQHSPFLSNHDNHQRHCTWTLFSQTITTSRLSESIQSAQNWTPRIKGNSQASRKMSSNASSRHISSLKI